MTLAPNEVHVWYRLTESLDDSALAAARSVLSSEECLRHDRFQFARDRRDYAAAHALLRTSLSRYADVSAHAWTFEKDTHGKPKLSPDRCGTGLALTFNLSHARGIVACAIAPGPPVGIDVERTDPTVDWSPVVERYFTRAEIAQLDRCLPSDRAARFAALWTLKEAHIKATGSGLSESLPSPGFDLSGDRIRLLAPANVNAWVWQFTLFAPEPRYRIGVAIVRRRTTEVWKIIARSSDEGSEAMATAQSAQQLHCI